MNKKSTITKARSKWLTKSDEEVDSRLLRRIIVALCLISISAFICFLKNGEGLAYNDARSHLNIGRRVVESLKPGLAQIGSVWLPLPHILMIPTVWNDFFWHSGLAGSIQSMVCYVAASVLIYLYLKQLRVGLPGRIFAVAIFSLNLNILYLQSTAMTELLLLASMTASSYFLLLWHKRGKITDLIKSGFFTMASTMVRYDGWFLLITSSLILALTTYRKTGYQKTEGVLVLFLSLSTLGIFLWIIWNILIFGDPLYFIFGPFSAHAQQQQIEAAGELFTKGNLRLSVKTYLWALFYNSYTFPTIASFISAIILWTDKTIKSNIRLSTFVLITPLLFNVTALYLGHSVLFVQGITGDAWFNVRYGLMLMPSIAIFIGYLVNRYKDLLYPLASVFALITFFSFINKDVVTIDDALIGASGKNVYEVSSWLNKNAKNEEGFILISVASHDAIIFSSGLPMKKFIHEGTGDYWKFATENPDLWARWIVLRTHDESDMTFAAIKDKPGFKNFELVDHYPFADIYSLKEEYLGNLNKERTLSQKTD